MPAHHCSLEAHNLSGLVALTVKNPPADAGDVGDAGLISGSGSSPGEGNGNAFQYSCLENPHGQRCLVGYSPQGHTESARTRITAEEFCLRMILPLRRHVYLLSMTFI